MAVTNTSEKVKVVEAVTKSYISLDNILAPQLTPNSASFFVI